MAGHHHDHHPAPRLEHGRAFAVGVGLNVAFVVVEAAFGSLSGSLALVADAGHNLSDVLGLLLAWGAAWMATLRPSRRLTYGLRRSTILASLASSLVLLVAIGGLVWEAIGRLSSPAPVASRTVMVVAGIGVAINTVTAVLFRRGREHDLNLRGAYLHMAADAAISLGVVLAGLGILLTGWSWLDPVVTIVIAVVILVGTLDLLRESAGLVLDAVPAGIDPDAVNRYLGDLSGVSEVHDLHIWGLSTTEASLTVHLVIPDGAADDGFLEHLCGELRRRFKIGHATVQVERGRIPCAQARPGSV